jgi:hypothetical protein
MSPEHGLREPAPQKIGIARRGIFCIFGCIIRAGFLQHDYTHKCWRDKLGHITPRAHYPSGVGVVLHAVVVVVAEVVLRELPVRLLQARVRLQLRHVLAQVVAIVIVT